MKIEKHLSNDALAARILFLLHEQHLLAVGAATRTPVTVAAHRFCGAGFLCNHGKLRGFEYWTLFVTIASEMP